MFYVFRHSAIVSLGGVRRSKSTPRTEANRDHRRYVREFIRVIHQITDKTNSQAIYRRLLPAYAPARKPATATLALKKERFVKSLGPAPSTIDADTTPAASPAGNLVAELRQALEDLADLRLSSGASHADSYLKAQCNFLEQRLSHSENELVMAKNCAH